MLCLLTKMWGLPPCRSFYNNVELMEGLVAAGADITAVDISGRTPLHVAAMSLRKDACVWLFEVRSLADLPTKHRGARYLLLHHHDAVDPTHL